MHFIFFVSYFSIKFLADKVTIHMKTNLNGEGRLMQFFWFLKINYFGYTILQYLKYLNTFIHVFSPAVDRIQLTTFATTIFNIYII